MVFTVPRFRLPCFPVITATSSPYKEFCCSGDTEYSQLIVYERYLWSLSLPKCGLVVTHMTSWLGRLTLI